MWWVDLELWIRLAVARFGRLGRGGPGAQAAQSMVEYAIVAALVAIVALAAVTTLGKDVAAVFTRIAGQIAGLGQGGGGP